MFKVYYKGGSWNYIGKNCRSAYSDWWHRLNCNNYRGFRIVLRKETHD